MTGLSLVTRRPYRRARNVPACNISPADDSSRMGLNAHGGNEVAADHDDMSLAGRGREPCGREPR